MTTRTRAKLEWCLADGTYVAVRVSREDLYGHFPFLKLFYAPDAPEETTDESFDVGIAGGGITITVVPRDAGSGEGHAGLADLTGTIDEDLQPRDRRPGRVRDQHGPVRRDLGGDGRNTRGDGDDAAGRWDPVGTDHLRVHADGGVAIPRYAASNRLLALAAAVVRVGQR